MKRVMLGVLGGLVGAVAGGIIGAVAGTFWISVLYPNDIYGYSAILIVVFFIPGGIVLGALVGVVATLYFTAAGGASRDAAC
jgi:hypothetical protein